MGSQAMSGRVSQQLAQGFALLQKHGSHSSAAKSGVCRSVSFHPPLQSRSGYIARVSPQLEQTSPKSKSQAAEGLKIGRSSNARSKQKLGVAAGVGERSEGINGGLRRIYSTRASAEAQTATRNDAGRASAPLTQDDKWEIKMLYDGECPLCMREVNMLRKRDAGTGKIKFVDIASDSYDPAENANIDFETAMGRIHGIQRDGTIVTNVEAFRKFYEAVGLGWVYAITKNKAVLKAADAVYDVWAKYRMQVTGRPPIEQVVEEKRKRQEQLKGAIKDRCRMDSAEC